MRQESMKKAFSNRRMEGLSAQAVCLALRGVALRGVVLRGAVLSGVAPVGLALLGLALLGAMPLRAQISLATVVDLAQQNSSSVKLAEADTRKARAILTEMNDVYIPNLDIGSSIGPPTIGFPAGQPSIANATMSSLVFSFSQGFYIKAARAAYKAASLALKDAREQTALDASTTYIELDTVERERDEASQQQTDANRLEEIEQARAEAGVDSHSDLLQSRLTLAELHLKQLHLASRAAVLRAELASMTGLPVASIHPLHSSIPAIPAVTGQATETPGLAAANASAQSRLMQAKGDAQVNHRPLITFGAQYNRDSNSLNNYSTYYQHFKADNFSIGVTIQIPIFDLIHRDKARESAADALRTRVEAEQASRQNDLQIATLDASLDELSALTDIAQLKQEIAHEQLKEVQSELQYGNGSSADPGASPQVTPKALQLALIDEQSKAMDAAESEFDLCKARLSLLRALGHMEDWLKTLGPATLVGQPTGQPTATAIPSPAP